MSEDIALAYPYKRAPKKENQDDTSDLGQTENNLISYKNSILEISDEDGYEDIYDMKMDSKDGLNLENLDFDNIIQRRKNKKQNMKINEDQYEGGSPKLAEESSLSE